MTACATVSKLFVNAEDVSSETDRMLLLELFEKELDINNKLRELVRTHKEFNAAVILRDDFLDHAIRYLEDTSRLELQLSELRQCMHENDFSVGPHAGEPRGMPDLFVYGGALNPAVYSSFVAAPRNRAPPAASNRLDGAGDRQASVHQKLEKHRNSDAMLEVD